MPLIHGIFRIMGRRFYYIISVLITVLFCSQEIYSQQTSIYNVAKMQFNAGSFSDISPVIFSDGILFCSTRRFSSFKDRTSFDGHRLYNIYVAHKRDSSDWSTPEEIVSDRSSKFNSGPLCLSSDGKTVYFTSEVETGKPAKSKKFKNHNGIFIGELSGTDITSLHPFKYNSTEYEVGQPSISKDGKYLFFSSDMPGGMGKSDIYYCEFVNGDWAAPVNLGPKVNSPDVENYPYIHPSGKLYFASDRPGGFGKLDLYFTSLNYGKWEDPVLLPEPINSASDDFAFAAEANLQSGYFSSNREYNDDIFSFKSNIKRFPVCDSLVENSYCYRFMEENAVRYKNLPFRFDWKFGDGAKATGVIVEHCYKGPGTYIVQLDVTNLVTKEVTLNEKSDTLVLKAVEQPYITGPDKIMAGQRIVMNADSTNLPGWKIADYYWNYGDETIGNGDKVEKTYSKPGIYNIQLIVTAEHVPGGKAKEACVSKNIIVIPEP